MNPTLLGLLRHGLTFAGAILVTKGVVSAEEATELAANVETAIGGAIALFSVGSFAIGRFRAWRAAKAA